MNPILAALCVLAIAIIVTCIVLAVRWSRRPLWCPHLARDQINALYVAGLMSDSEHDREMDAIAQQEMTQ